VSRYCDVFAIHFSSGRQAGACLPELSWAVPSTWLVLLFLCGCIAGGFSIAHTPPSEINRGKPTVLEFAPKAFGNEVADKKSNYKTPTVVYRFSSEKTSTTLPCDIKLHDGRLTLVAELPSPSDTDEYVEYHLDVTIHTTFNSGELCRVPCVNQ
jgi:hypothetical protein